MWVYQEPSQLPALSADGAVNNRENVTEESTEDTTAVPAELVPAPELPEHPTAPIKAPTVHASRDCILLAAAYLFGTFLAGVLCALCNAGEAETLGYYLDCWRESFTASNAAEVAALFRTELLTASGALTVLLLLGLSALGTVPIFCFVILYGAGAGMLSFQLLAEVKLRALLAYCVASGIPTALAAGCLCLFGAGALQVSTRLQRCSFGRGFPTPGAWGLLGQFIRTLFLLLPICGAATGLLYLCGQAGLLR